MGVVKYALGVAINGGRLVPLRRAADPPIIMPVFLSLTTRNPSPIGSGKVKLDFRENTAEKRGLSQKWI